MRRGFWLQNGRGPTIRETAEYAPAAEEGGWDGIVANWPALRDADDLAACEDPGVTWPLRGRADHAADLCAGPASLR